LAVRSLGVRENGRWRSVFELLGHAEMDLKALTDAFPWLRDVPPRALAQLRTEARYAGYLPRQDAEIRAVGREEAVELGGVVYGNVGGLSAELVTKLTDARPITLGVASRIQGMTPAAMAAIVAHVRKRSSGHRST
jgi:tRNA uridine 5-carboxymethylaminomethyl modification enzyme